MFFIVIFAVSITKNQEEIMRIINDIAAYIKSVTDLIWNFILNRDSYPENAQLAVLPELMETVIDNPAECKGCDFYDIKMLMSVDANGNLSPNERAIRNMANRYF